MYETLILVFDQSDVLKVAGELVLNFRSKACITINLKINSVFYSSNLFKDFFLSNMEAQIEAKICNNLKSKFVYLIHILSQIGLAPCFSPKHKILGNLSDCIFYL